MLDAAWTATVAALAGRWRERLPPDIGERRIVSGWDAQPEVRLGPEHLQTLEAIRSLGPVSTATLGDRLGVKRSTLRMRLQKIEAAGRIVSTACGWLVL